MAHVAPPSPVPDEGSEATEREGREEREEREEPDETDERDGRETRESRENAHESDVAEREAYEYWGYLFKPDKTGSNRLKSLLRGLKDVMVRASYSSQTTEVPY